MPVTLPSGKAARIKIDKVALGPGRAEARVIKDAGDDPDVTHGAAIVTAVELVGGPGPASRPRVEIRGGKGVGVVTKPGLKVRPGRPAINPVPMSMIRTAVMEAAREAGVTPRVAVTVCVPDGERLAKKTMNERLGIIGGISILGTTGIVEPLSLDAYRDSIVCALDVARAASCATVALSTGRSSEKVAEAVLKLPRPAFVMTGDHMGYALAEAARRPGIKKAVVAGQFGKFTKLGAGSFETHCSDSSVDLGFLAGLCEEAGLSAGVIDAVRAANTAREAFFIIRRARGARVFRLLCLEVKRRAAAILGANAPKGARPPRAAALLVGYEDDAVALL